MSFAETSQQQKFLFQPLCGIGNEASSSLQRRIGKAKKGHLPQGVTLDNISPKNLKVFEVVLGDFKSKTILVTDPQEINSLIPEQLAIAGGWCALRTADINQLNQGLIINPITNQPEKIDSVNQVTDWLAKSTTFDQVTEAIGANIANEAVAISETRLWSTRVCDKLSQIFRKPLEPQEKEQIEQAVEDAELTRFKLTQRYLQLVTNNQSPSLTRVTDRSIWQELAEARDELLSAANISIEDLSRKFAQSTDYIKNRGRIWAMYSQPYFSKLRNLSFINSPQVLISEPSLHTFATSESGRFIVDNIYHRQGIYFDPQGINPDTGFIVFIEALTSRGKSVRRELPVGACPNISNWEQLFDRRSFSQSDSPLRGILAAENNLSLNPATNNLFIWGLNFLPFGETLETLEKLILLKKTFDDDKKTTQKQIPQSERGNRANINSLAGSVNLLKTETQYKIQTLNLRIEKDLFNFFQSLTQNL